MRNQRKTYPAWRLAGGIWFFVVSLLWGITALAGTSDTDLLKRADTIKTADNREFSSILDSLGVREGELAADDRLYLKYLRAWQIAYKGNYAAAIATLEELLAQKANATLDFRARATLVNVLSIAKRYDNAFAQLSRLLDDLPSIHDPAAREQGLFVAALLYERVGQANLALVYAQNLIDENWAGRGKCRGGEIRLEALAKTGTLAELQNEFDQTQEQCIRSKESLYVGLIRTSVARVYIREKRYSDTISLLTSHYDEVLATHYPPLISAYEAALAQAYWETGDKRLARQFAQRSVDDAVKTQYTESLVTAYRVLYLLSKQQGDAKAALEFHEQFAAANTAYLDDVTAQQLAYQRVKHEVTANKLQIETLNKRNQVLQLERKLDAKEIENVRLYVALLIAVLAFIAFWGYKTKRSQLHFMNLARRDSLTEITNRQHFIELAEGVLKNCSNMEQEATLILCDLDNFKSINDRYGHAQGDKVLKQAAAACREHLRVTDIFARVGGEEFCILLTGCNVAGATERAERLRVALSAIDHTGMISKVSGSFGITSTKISGYELHQLMAHADFALYQAKNAGRNRVVTFDPMTVVAAADTAHESGYTQQISAS